MIVHCNECFATETVSTKGLEVTRDYSEDIPGLVSPKEEGIPFAFIDVVERIKETLSDWHVEVIKNNTEESLYLRCPKHADTKSVRISAKPDSLRILLFQIEAHLRTLSEEKSRPYSKSLANNLKFFLDSDQI